MDEFIKIENVSYDYESFDEEGPDITALKNINLNIEKGSFTAILGMNGSGKSTLAKNLNALFIPTKGTILVKNMDTSDEGLVWDIRKTAGMVFQNPDNQIVSAIVEDDVAFGPENLGVDSDEIRLRIDDAMKSTGIYEQRHKAPNMLSGGQKQRVAIAGVLAMKPECIIFDEPTAMLDPEGRREVLEIIQRLNKEKITVILITHFMEEAAMANRIIVMKNGEIISDGVPAEIFSRTELVENAGLELPLAVTLKNKLRKHGLEIPDTVMEIESLADCLYEIYDGSADAAGASSQNPEAGAAEHQASAVKHADNDETLTDPTTSTAPAVSTTSTAPAAPAPLTASTDMDELAVVAQHLTHVYNSGQQDETKAVEDVSFEIKKGDFVGIIGHTGSGKSTLIQHINGTLKASSGNLYVGGQDITEKGISLLEIRKKTGLVFQYPEYQLFEETVAKDVAFGPQNLGLDSDEIQQRVKEAMELVGLDFDVFAERSPFELSGGQKRRAAIAGVLAMRPEVLILDEPTAGLDPQAHKDIMQMVMNIREQRRCTVILVSHNMDDVNRMCNQVLVMNHGKLVLSGSPSEVFSQDDFLKSIGLGMPAAGELLYVLKNRIIKNKKEMSIVNRRLDGGNADKADKIFDADRRFIDTVAGFLKE